ncbi:hypothetical protein CHS0354_011021 [Potamilus streckersoni]|uniref:Uncharacterized protein n=1 Tax=Potamilus streckersoni TaxID=2493646 RepID=A0AAE0WH35_9BIVA|nr:hypothetical protein CHS0354_011021 [Potamilus streckersoni]
MVVGNWHHVHVEGIQQSYSLMNAEGEQQFRKTLLDIRLGGGGQSLHTEFSLAGKTKSTASAEDHRVPFQSDYTESERLTVLSPECIGPTETVLKELTLHAAQNTSLTSYISEPHQHGYAETNYTDTSAASSGCVRVYGTNIYGESQYSSRPISDLHLRVSVNSDFTETSTSSSSKVSGNTTACDVTTQHELVTKSKFVKADTMLPPDSNSEAGVYVWEQTCIPNKSDDCGKQIMHSMLNNFFADANKIISTDPETLLAKLRQDDGKENVEKHILGQFLPHIGHHWGIKNVSGLLAYDSIKVRCLVVDTIEDICYRHNPSRINPEHFLEAAEVILASIVRNIGDEACVAKLSYILILSLSMLYLAAIAKQNVSTYILGEKLQKYCRELSKLNPKQHIRIRYFIEILHRFMMCLVTNVRNLNKGHWLQVENWDEILRTSHSKAEDIRRMSAKCNLCDRISILVLLLNVIHRLNDTDLHSQLLLKLVKEALNSTAWFIKSRRSRSKHHAIALLISRGCRYILEKKPLIGNFVPYLFGELDKTLSY